MPSPTGSGGPGGPGSPGFTKSPSELPGRDSREFCHRFFFFNGTKAPPLVIAPNALFFAAGRQAHGDVEGRACQGNTGVGVGE